MLAEKELTSRIIRTPDAMAGSRASEGGTQELRRRMLKDEALTSQIIGAAVAVHRALGPGFLESIYGQALAIEFEHAGLACERQKVVPVNYRGRQIGEHRLDFLVEDRVVVELKAVLRLENIFFVVVRSCLKATGLETGLLFNFASMPLSIKRVSPEDLQYLHGAS